jgi:fucose permease
VAKKSFLLIGLAYLGFISIGLPDGLLGVAWPSIRSSFGLPLDALGALLVASTTGYVLSSFSSGRILSSINVGVLLALSCLATAVSLFGYALTPFWWVMVVFGLLAGLGAGAIDAGINTYAATYHSARTVNWLHACYGVGAASGPVIMTSVIGAGLSWQWGYGFVAIGQLLLAGCFSLTQRQWPRSVAATSIAPASEQAATVATHEQATKVATTSLAREQATTVATTNQISNVGTLQLPIVWLSIAAFFIYTGLEAAAGAWAYSLFTEARAIPMSTAGLWVSIYWGGLAIGRFLCGLAIGFVSVSLLLPVCMVSIALGATLIWLNFANMLSFLGLALIGLASGPVFPSLIATTPERLGEVHTANGVGFQIAGAALGQSLLPWVVGMLAHQSGLEIVGPALLTAAVFLLVVYISLSAVASAKTCNRVISSSVV